jgi:EpsI family protein
MLITSVALPHLIKSEAVKANMPLSLFPMTIGRWKGNVDQFDDWVYKKTGVDDSILSHYYDASGHYVQLYIGYYQSQKEKDIIHSPRNCMPGTGWNIVETSRTDLRIPSHHPDPVKVGLLRIQKESRKQLVLYWYQSRGRIISSEYHQKFYLVLDSLTRQRTDGSFIRLISPVNESEKEALDVLKRFAEGLFPILEDYIPS